MKNEIENNEELYRLRLSFEAVSINDCKFSGLVYIKWNEKKEFGIKTSYKTHPAL